MRTAAEVGEVTLGIGGNGTVFKVLLDVLTFVGLACCGKCLEGIGLGHLLAHHRLFLRSQFLHLRLNLREVALLDALAVLQQHIIEETILDGRSESELDAGVQLLQCFCQQVGRRVPEGVLALFVIPLVQLNLRITGDGAVEFHGLAIHTAGQYAACQSWRDALGNLESGNALLIRANRAIRKGNVNHIYNICLV